MSIRIFQYRYEADVTPDLFRDVLGALSAAGNHLLIASANSAYISALGMNPKDSTIAGTLGTSTSLSYRDGDFIAAPGWDEIAYIARAEESGMHGFLRTFSRTYKRKHYLECGAVTTGGESKILEGIKRAISGVLIPESARPEALIPGKFPGWSQLSWPNKKFEELRSRHSFTDPAFGDKEIRAANLLADKGLLRLVTEARKLSKSGTGLAKFKQMNASDQDIEKLTSADLLRVEEGGEKIISTPLAKMLLDHSNWMSVLLTQRLKTLGVTEDRILLEFRDGTEEIDAFVDIDGKLLLVELKDKEFSMGSWNALAERKRLYNPDHVLIVSGDKVSRQVRGRIEQSKWTASVTCVDGLDKLGTEVGLVATTIRKSNLASLLERFDQLTPGAKFSELIMLKLGLPIERKEPKSVVGKKLIETVYGKAEAG